MWIRGQDKETLVNISQVNIEEGKKKWLVEGESISEGYVTLGEYSTKEMAKEEIGRIFRALKAGDNTYSMSKDINF